MPQTYKAISQKIAIILCIVFLFSSVEASEDFSKAVVHARPSVVRVMSVGEAKDPLVPDKWQAELEGTRLMELLKKMYGDKLEDQLSTEADSQGSGCILSKDGYIVTNAHVVADAKAIYVRLWDQREFQAEFIGLDEGTDLALLKITADDLVPLQYADSDKIAVGEWVMAIGAPFGFEDSVTVGVVSALNRSLSSERYVPFIQTDAAVNPGNSGGPLLNKHGELVGINAQIVSGTGDYAGLSFAVPANLIKHVVMQLKEHGKVTRGWLGISFQELDRDLADSFGLSHLRGALVSKVVVGGPAWRAGLREGDVIERCNGISIMKAMELPPLLGVLPIGESVSVQVVRGSKQQIFTMTMMPSQKEEVHTEIPLMPKKDWSGIFVRDLDGGEKRAIQGEKGVYVEHVTGKMWQQAGIRNGDVIVSLGAHFINDAQTFYCFLQGAKEKGTLPVLVARAGQQRYVAVKFLGQLS